MPNRKRSLSARVERWPRGVKRLIVIGADAVAIPLAFWVAVVLKADKFIVPDDRLLSLFAIATVVALTQVCRACHMWALCWCSMQHFR